MQTVWSPTITVALLCLLAGPTAYAFNNMLQSSDSAVMLLIASVILSSIMGITFFMNSSKVKNKMYYWFGLFAFTSAVDIFAALEADGIISGFMELYLKYGEPYLFSPWGSIAAYWDGTVFLTSYLVMAYCASNGLSYRSLGIHYSAAIINSMIVLLLGACLSTSGMSWCTMLNIPYVIVPLLTGIQCLSEQRKRGHSRSSTLTDKYLALLLTLATCAGLVKGLACLGSQQHLALWYKSNVEPITMQTTPAPFAWLQGLIMIFYFVPCFVILTFGLILCPSAGWMIDLSLVVAGATSQAGAAQIGMSFHPATSTEHQAPSIADRTAYSLFWASNILTALLPQVVALWLCYFSIEKLNLTKKGSLPGESNVIKTKSDKKEGKNASYKNDRYLTEAGNLRHTDEIKGKASVNVRKIKHANVTDKKTA